VVEKANHSAAQRWWRTLGDDVTIAEAQAGLDRLTVTMDGRRRVRDGERTTVEALAAAEHLHPAPLMAFPAELDVTRVVTAQALISFRGNQYSVPPGLGGAQVQVRHRLGGDELRIVTARGAVVAAHRRVPDGAGRVIRDDGHVVALERVLCAELSNVRLPGYISGSASATDGAPTSFSAFSRWGWVPQSVVVKLTRSLEAVS
jgi:hypothetical protein